MLPSVNESFDIRPTGVFEGFLQELWKQNNSTELSVMADGELVVNFLKIQLALSIIVCKAKSFSALISVYSAIFPSNYFRLTISFFLVIKLQLQPSISYIIFIKTFLKWCINVENYGCDQITTVILSRSNYFFKNSLHKLFSKDCLFKILQSADQEELNTRTGVPRQKMKSNKLAKFHHKPPSEIPERGLKYFKQNISPPPFSFIVVPEQHYYIRSHATESRGDAE